MGSSDSSVRSPSREDKSKRRPPTWGDAPATDFAITTINVPDRLDVQEVRAREEEDSYQPRSRFSLDRYTVTVWTKRLLSLGVVGGLGWLAWALVTPLVAQLDKDAIAARLSAGAGVPVTIADRSFALWPMPRMMLRDVNVGGGRFKAELVTLQVNWDELTRAAKLGKLALGEAVVSPVQLTAQQAVDLVTLGPKLAGATGVSVSTLRLSSVEFPEFSLLPHRYEIVLRRPAAGAAAPVVVNQLASDGTMQLRATPAAEGAVAFEIEAQNWRAPIGPGHVWATFSASGRAAGQALVVDSYTASSSAGVVQGALVAASDVAWSVAGTARSVSVDLETVMRQLSGARPDDPAAPRPPLQGTATVTLFGSGHGPSLADATFGARMAGPVSVRWATLNGINLGLAATQGGVSETGGGNTRFTELSALAEFSDAGLVLRDIDGRAGAMATRGQVTIAPDLALTGALRVDLGATRVQAPATLRVAGTAVAPRYGRQ
jgi:hypothetical protein